MKHFPALFFSILALFGSILPALADNQVNLYKYSAPNGDITLNFSGPVTFKTERFKNPERLVINLYSVNFDRTAHEVSRLRTPWLKDLKSELLLGDSIRLSFFLKNGVNPNVYGKAPTNTLIISPKSHVDEEQRNGIEKAPVQTPQGDTDSGEGTEVGNQDSALQETPGNHSTPNDNRIKIDRINFENGDTMCRLQFSLSGPVKPQAFLLNPDPPRSANYRLVLDLPNTLVSPPEQTIPITDNALVKRIRTGVFDFTVSRIVLDLKQKADFSVTNDPATGQVILTVVPLGGSPDNGVTSPYGSADTGNGEFNGIEPSTEAGALRGRTIVLDAGHGGHDKGTSGSGMFEKNVALDITKRLATLLKDAGVNAVLTRSDDTFIRLPDRPAVANRMGADAFVAIHLNSTGSVRNIWSGTETYFHFQNPDCKELAQYIQSQLVQAIGLPDRGARSDTRIAPRMGFSVLRNSEVPAVLVEVGYLNHPGDAAKLKRPEFRQRAAEGIMAGLRSYFGRNDRSARRSSAQ